MVLRMTLQAQDCVVVGLNDKKASRSVTRERRRQEGGSTNLILYPNGIQRFSIAKSIDIAEPREKRRERATPATM